MSEYSYPKVDENGKIICQICGESFSQITPNHLKRHKVDMKTYRMRFPEAPLTTEEFKTKQKYSKTKIFKEEKDEYINPVIEKIIKEVKEPEIEEVPEIEYYEETVSKIPKNSIKRNKDNILSKLREVFPNMEKDYLIQNIDRNNRLLYEFITDFADPVLKIDLEFPGMFWHNGGSVVHPSRDLKLKTDHWKVINLKNTDITYILKKIEES